MRPVSQPVSTLRKPRNEFTQPWVCLKVVQIECFQLIALLGTVDAANDLTDFDEPDSLPWLAQGTLLPVDGDAASQVLTAYHILPFPRMFQQCQVVNLAVAQMDQGPVGEQLLDRVNGSLGLLQMVSNGQDPAL